jgi:hypothetical protein
MTPTTRALAARLCEAVRAATVRADQTIAADDLSLYLAQDALRAALAAEPEPRRLLVASWQCPECGELHGDDALDFVEWGTVLTCPTTGHRVTVALCNDNDWRRLNAEDGKPAGVRGDCPRDVLRPDVPRLASGEEAPTVTASPSPERERLAEQMVAIISKWDNDVASHTLLTWDKVYSLADFILARLLRAPVDRERHPALTCGDCGAQMMHVCLDCHTCGQAR